MITRTLIGSALRVAVATLLLAACSPAAVPTATPLPTPQMPAAGSPPLVLTNATTMSLQLLVNGTAVGEAAANAELSVPADTLPAYPWHVAAKTDGGRTLAILEVTGDVERTTLPDGSTQVNGYGTTAYLSCGQLVLSYGPPPLGGPPTGPAGDCM